MIEYDETAKPKTKQRGSGSALNCFVMWFAPHIRQWAIIYVFLCYGAFVIAHLSIDLVDIEDPYGLAMIVIGLFWLAIIKVFDMAESKIST